MSPVTNVVVAAALALGMGGAIVAGVISESDEPLDVGDPIMIESDQTDAPTESPRGDPTNPAAAAPGRPGNDVNQPGAGDGRDRDDRTRDDRDRDDRDRDDDGNGASGTIDDGEGGAVDDDVDEVFPSPRTLSNDDGTDGGADDRDDGGDDGEDGDDRDERGDD